MSEFADQAFGYLSSMVDSVVSWLFTLNHEEWVLVLVAVTVCGFFCMRGFGSRHNY